MVISHRFRKFILGGLVLVTASQFAALLLTTRPHADVKLFNTGELAVRFSRFIWFSVKNQII